MSNMICYYFLYIYITYLHTNIGCSG